MRFLYEKTRGLLEREMPIVRSIVQRGDRIADVGANHGLYTHLLAKRGAVVEAFEPQPECVAVLRAYAARQRSGSVRVHPVALSATPGRGALHVPAGSDSSPSATLVSKDANGGALEVMLERLDTFCFGDLVLVKIDVEGSELDVLRGAEETLRRCRPLLFVEIEQRHHREPIADVFDEIASQGYEGAFLDSTGRLLPLAAFSVERHQLEPALHPASGRPYINNFFFNPLGFGSGARRWPL